MKITKAYKPEPWKQMSDAENGNYSVLICFDHDIWLWTTANLVKGFRSQVEILATGLGDRGTPALSGLTEAPEFIEVSASPAEVECSNPSCRRLNDTGYIKCWWCNCKSGR